MGLAPFWSGEDGRRRRPAQPVLVCQVLRQKLQSLQGVGALLPEHHHTGLMSSLVACGVGLAVWFRTGPSFVIGVGSNRKVGTVWPARAPQEVPQGPKGGGFT